MMISFDVTKEEQDLIEKIAKRAHWEIFNPHGIDQSIMDTQMDLAATIAQGCQLKLESLLNADASNFAHDICGIRRHIDRRTGLLRDFFLPRFAEVERMQATT